MNGTGSAVKLNTAALAALQEDIRRPAYDRSALIQHTVHIGVGGFHRAHQAVYLDDLLTIDNEPRWGECGIGLLKSDERMRDALMGQDCLYTVVQKSAQSQAARVIGSIVDYFYAPDDHECILEKMAAQETRIVSLTITEGGYFIDEATRDFMPDHPQIQHDLQHPKDPMTSFGYIAAALDRRRHRGLQPFTLMSCDNLQGNGDVAKRVLLGFAHLKDPSLEQWIGEHMTFPNSMVDRITPGTTPEDQTALRKDFGIEDAWPVMTEPFLQWVIEDHFCNGRPRWEKVGAELVADVAPYELMKMRLLNGSHLAMAYLGALAGYSYVHEVMQDPVFTALIENFMNEVTPVVPTIPGVSVEDYKKVLVERFANPAIRDQITRICSEGSAKMPKWVLPSVSELLKKGLPTKLLGLVIASWIYYLKQGINERGDALEIIDARVIELRERARTARADPRPMLAVTSIFGQQLPSNLTFVSEVERALDLLSKIGVTATIRRYLSSTAEPFL